MPLDDLLSAMRAAGDEEIARLERDSRLEAAEILHAAERQARSIDAQVLRAAQVELDAQLARRRSRARLEARRALRAAREEAFAELLDDVRVRLAALRESGPYRAVFTELLRESRAALPAGRRLRVDPRDEALARELGAELELPPVLQTAGGLELETDDGRLLRNTFESRLAAAEPLLRLRLASLAARLNGGRPTGDEAEA
jgi:V/A-type H+/Na+-transporting ATPase subunit E